MTTKGCRKDTGMGKSGRLISLDVLRGFDMLLIMGAANLICLIVSAIGCEATWLTEQLHHATWNGLRFYDTVFPLFLFLAGVSWPFSLTKQRERGASTGAVVSKVIRRGLLLSVLGFVYNGVLKLDFGHMVWGAVLVRIGVAWSLAALLSIFFSTRTLVVFSVVVLTGYWAVSVFVAAPDALDACPLSMEGCFAGWVDRMVMPGKLTVPGIISNQGILSTFPAIVTALLGIFAGKLLRQNDLTGERKALVLVVGAVVLVVLGCIVAFGLGCYSAPFNKILWSTSFTLAVGGYSAGMLALFYWLIDVKGWWKRTLAYRVIGMNSITIYMANRIMRFGVFATFFFGGLSGLLPNAWGRVLLASASLAFQWLFLYFLYRNKWFLRV